MKKITPSVILLLALLAIIAGYIFYRLVVTRQLKFIIPEQSNNAATSIKHSIPLDQIYDGGPGKDGIPSIDNPKFISVSQASSDFSLAGLGLSVSFNGEDRFYPYQILVWHEIINDVIRDVPILVTFCPLCGSGLVFDRRVNDQILEFGVSGKLHNSDLLMYDRQTDTLWQQLLGAAVVGPLTGTDLLQLDADVVTFSAFANKFPSGLVLSKETGYVRDYDRTPYQNYDSNSDIYFPVTNLDSRLHPKTRVLGVIIGDKHKAYVEESIRTLGVVTDTFNDKVIKFESKAGFITVTNMTDQTKIIPVYNFWFAWAAFYPETELYQ